MLLRVFTVSVGVVVSYGVFCFAPTFGAPTQTVRFAGTKSVSACGEFRYDQAPEVATGISPFAITVADIDGDGREDLVSGFQGIGGGGVAIARNLGGGRYAPRVTYGVTSGSFSPETVAARDIDADGRPDIFASSAETRIVYFRNNSSPGAIQLGSSVFLPMPTFNARTMAFGDFDGDGQLDLLGGSYGDSPTISVFRNISAGTGTITFGPRIDIPVGTFRVVAAADFDGDTKIDFVVAGGTGGAFRVFRNTGSGNGDISFSAPATFEDTTNVTGVTVLDVDGDSKPEIAVSASRTVVIYPNTGSGPGNVNFASRFIIQTGFDRSDITSSDFDGDGMTDIGVPSHNGNSVAILKNTSNTPGTLSFSARSWDYGVGDGPYRIAAGDLNGDGKRDLATANRLGNSVTILINRVVGGAIDFESRRDYLTPSSSGVTNVAIEDFDGDGLKDLAASFDEIENSFKFSVYRNDGAGHFSVRTDFAPANSIISSVEPFFISAGDFDSDSRPDIAMVGRWFNSQMGRTLVGVMVFRNIGSAGFPNFTISSYTAEIESANRVFVDDFDSDGKPDILATHKQVFGNETAVIFRNTSSGTGLFSFSQATTLLLRGTPLLGFGDLNLDGKTDIAYGYGNGPIRIHASSQVPGEIAFTNFDAGELGQSFGSTALADFDGDSRTDLVTNDLEDVFFLKNTGSVGTIGFAPSVTFPAMFAETVATGDFDGDSKIDVVGRNSGLIKILKNTSSGSAPNFTNDFSTAIGGNNNAGRHSYLGSADINNDGRLDIVNGYFGSFIGTITVLLSRPCDSVTRSPFDFDGDGRSDASIFRPSSGQWWLNRSTDGVIAHTFGNESDRLVPADYTGDGKSDIAVFRPASGEWFILRSEDYTYYSFPFGLAGDVPVPADFDSDGMSDAALFRPATSTWYVARSSGGTLSTRFGLTGDLPVPDDYDGDGAADIAIYRPALGQWWLQRSSAGLIALSFGNSSDKPVPGDFTGDGKSDVALWRPATGYWYVLRSEDASFFAFPFGTSGDVPVPGDFDGDGRADSAVFRPSNATWYLNQSSAGVSIFGFGLQSDVPIPGVLTR